MATKITCKKPNFGNSRSHAKNQGNKIQKLNFQTITVNGVKVKVTAREKRAFDKATTVKETKTVKKVEE